MKSTKIKKPFSTTRKSSPCWTIQNYSYAYEYEPSDEPTTRAVVIGFEAKWKTHKMDVGIRDKKAPQVEIESKDHFIIYAKGEDITGSFTSLLSTLKSKSFPTNIRIKKMPVSVGQMFDANTLQNFFDKKYIFKLDQSNKEIEQYLSQLKNFILSMKLSLK